VCPECGATLPDSGDCWTRVHQLLEIETRVLPGLDSEHGMRAHFFAIASYQLQHPFRVGADTLPVLRDSVRRALGPSAPPIAHIRHEMGRHMTSGAKAGRMAAPGDRSHVDPAWPREWTVTAEDVLAGSEQDYPQAVRSWAASTVDDLDRALG